MTDTFDWAGLTTEIVKCHSAKYPVDLLHLLRTRIEAAFVQRKQPLHCETCGTDVAEVLCAKCGEWWRDNSPEVHEATARAEAAEARVTVLEEALRECRDQLWCHAKNPGSNPWIKQADAALGAEHE